MAVDTYGAGNSRCRCIPRSDHLRSARMLCREGCRAMHGGCDVDLLFHDTTNPTDVESKVPLTFPRFLLYAHTLEQYSTTLWSIPCWVCRTRTLKPRFGQAEPPKAQDLGPTVPRALPPFACDEERAWSATFFTRIATRSQCGWHRIIMLNFP